VSSNSSTIKKKKKKKKERKIEEKKTHIDLRDKLNKPLPCSSKEVLKTYMCQECPDPGALQCIDNNMTWG
jgi:hypothetical protein